ncbi:MAG: hypothetical protein KF708_14600, partial [Pirellulales bacterium]|nr:hypothetical protein [Pirellulales bacterium]
TSPRLYVLKMTNETTSSTTLLNGWTVETIGPELWMKIEDDGTDLKFFIGLDGNTWIQIASEGRGSFMSGGPDEVGWGANNQSNTVAPIACSLLHWNES